MQDKLKKEILESFEKEFGIHFKDSSGELQFVKEFISDTIDRVREEERERIRWSWDIGDGTDSWCVQIWYGNTLIDAITPQSKSGGKGKFYQILTQKDKE